MSSAREVDLVRFRGRDQATETDEVAHEEPLEVQVNGASVAVLMRTPGDDEELVRGFLLTERIVATLAEVDSLHHCTRVPHPEAEDNIMQVRLKRGLVVDLERRDAARDAAVLVTEKRYRFVSAGAVNMFPHTAHVESIAVFERP